MKKKKKKEEALIRSKYKEHKGYYPRYNAGDFRWHFRHLKDHN